MKKIRVKEGFTLIELMIVIAVIGILAAVLIPYTYRAQDRARETGVLNAAKAIQTGLEMYASNKITSPWYPRSQTELTDTTAGLASYLSPMPKNPFTSTVEYLEVIGSSGDTSPFYLGTTSTGSGNPGVIVYQTNGNSYTLIPYGARGSNVIGEPITGGHQ
jgi:prepilin-type N-terminal cleavage/methylation domain-containing protein